MKYVLSSILLVAYVGTARATDRINHYDVQNMSCNQVHIILQEDGAAILRYPAPSGSGRILYDRYVANNNICFGEHGHAVQRTIPVKGTRACPVLKCKSGPRECDNGIGLFACMSSDD